MVLLGDSLISCLARPSEVSSFSESKIHENRCAAHVSTKREPIFNNLLCTTWRSDNFSRRPHVLSTISADFITFVELDHRELEFSTEADVTTCYLYPRHFPVR